LSGVHRFSACGVLMREDVDNPVEPLPPPLPPPLPAARTTPPLRDALVLYALSCVLLLVVGGFWQGLDILSGLLVTELALILWPPAWYVWRKGYPIAASFYLASTSVLNGILSMLGAVAVFVVVAGLAQFQGLIFQPPLVYQEGWEQILRHLHGLPLPITLLIMAVLPGICEELLFRGLLLRSMRTACSDSVAVVVVGVLFGVFHFDPYRLMPVTLLGIFFGYLVVRTNSILPAMLAHIANNALAVSASHVMVRSQGNLALNGLADDLSFGELAWQIGPTMAWALGGFLVIIAVLRHVNPVGSTAVRP
jgi:uncharacterized protein